jgi:hypothetical protein
MTALELFKWADNTPISLVIRDSTYIFPVVEVIHLFGLTILMGCVITVSLRLLGYGLLRPVSEVHAGLAKWTWIGLGLTLITGTLLFLAEALKCYDNAAFPWKMGFIAAGLIVHFTGYLIVTKPGRFESSPGFGKVVAILSLLCWFGAGVGGRAIGFV